MSVVDDLVAISREVGGDPEWVLAGGGNTSAKENGVLYVKASGAGLSDITPDGFVKMDMARLDRIWGTRYPDEQKEREAQALADLMNARLEGEEAKRPSVETLMHALLPYTFVVHTHPSLINGITCSAEGATAAEKVFGENALWVPTVNPGYILAQTLKRAVDGYAAAHGAAPQIILLQNHGLVVSADSIEEIRSVQNGITASIRHHVEEYPDLTPVATPEGVAAEAVRVVREALGISEASFFSNTEIKRFCETAQSMKPLMLPFSPDHIVYAGVRPLFLPDTAAIKRTSLEKVLESYRSELGVAPRVVVFQGVGAVAAGDNAKAVSTAQALFTDAVKVAVYARSFGGPRALPDDQIAFIRNWEVETYRAKQSLGGS